jgi:NAD/NADP transhydrogenase alpha subunit
MKIAVAKEIDPSEPRVAASPDTVKKFKALGIDIAVERVRASSRACLIRNSPRPVPPSARTP